MTAVQRVLAIGWALFWLAWLIAGFSAKRSRVRWSRDAWIRLALVVAAILLVRLAGLRGHGVTGDPWLVGIGLALFLLGLAFAVWARITIGRNWGSPMSRKDAPELVTSGPYALVRHPIYSGILLAGVGTALALNWIWLPLVAIAGVYFVYSATVEERYLGEQLPVAYPPYRRSTKMLVPFVF